MTNDLDRALIALRVSRDHGHGAVLNDAEVPALLAEIERLRQWELVGREWAAKTDWMQSRDAPVRWLGKHRADALREEIERLTAERDELRDVLLRRGFVPCDIPACNCGSWHHRYGLPERMRDTEDTLAEAGHELSNANGNLPINALKALVAERDDLRRQLDEARAEREAMANVLPGVYYMDPPDGGDVSLLKQLQRMSNDAARYRLLRRKFAIISDGEGNAEFCPINLPRPVYIAPNTAIELDTALDRERLGLDGAKRPPTPVGWSDTDWIKHLQEQEKPHPMAGQHINQGSMDAAADAYEAEYNAARGIK
jgi:hypothetical protein